MRFWLARLKTGRKICVLPYPKTGFHVFSREHCQDISEFLSVRVADVFQHVHRITTNERMKTTFSSPENYFWILSLVWNTSSNISKFFPLRVENRHFCREGVRQFWKQVDVVVQVGRVAVAHQLLRGQKNLVWFNCRRDNLTVESRLTCGAQLFLFF